MNKATGFVILDTLGMLAVRGPDAAKFLQGQLTCNLNYVSHERTSLGARCNPKGRMQSSFRLAQQGDGYLLSMPVSLVGRQLEELKKFAVFSKSTLSDESSAWQQLGLIGADNALEELGIQLPAEPNSMVQHNDMLAIRVSAQLAELWLPASTASCTRQRLLGQLEHLEPSTWQLEMIRLGIAQFDEQGFESYLPQELNFQALDAVSFKKGCYSGQEIVARMQYLGKQKKRMYRFTTESSQLPAIGTALLDINGKKTGETVAVAAQGQRVELLAIVQSDATDAPLHLDMPGSPALQLQSLPYIFDTEREILR